MRTAQVTTSSARGAEQTMTHNTRQAGRFGWRMKTTAHALSLSLLGLFGLTPYAHAKQAGRVIDAQKAAQQAALRARIVHELKPGTTDKLTPAQWKAVDAQRAKEAQDREAHKPDVRVLSLKEMQSAKGSGPYRNKYFAGTLPWHRSLRDANLCNGNLFKSFTDMQVAPGRGAGLALQRTYNSQDDRPGPFGVGWGHAYDIRMEEENPTTNQTSENLNVADRTDFFGAKHKYHRDCDGLYSPPPYLFDETSSGYQSFLVNGPVVPLDDTEIGMDGTTKHFVSVGNNVRACDYIADRYGSRTNLVYGATVGGASVSNLLSTVTDPVGRQLVFTWANKGTAQQPVYRIVEVDGPQYSVIYGYNADANLSSVTLDPGAVGHLNRTTTLGYTTYDDGQGGVESGLLSSVTDPLGNTVSYTYQAGPGTGQDGGQVTTTGTAWIRTITEPAGQDPQTHQPRTHTMTLLTGRYGSSTPSVNVFYCNVTSSAGWQVAVWSNALLQKQAYQKNGTVTYPVQSTSYDSANNVVAVHTSRFDGVNPPSPTDLFRDDVFTFGPHGNQLTHQISGFPGTETTAYYNGSQYFQKQSVTDMNGHTTTFGVGSKYAGTAGNADTNPGDRGSVLWVKDAKYGDGTLNASGTRFQYAYNASGQKISESNQGINGGAGVVTNYAYGDTWGNLTSVVQDPGTGHLNRTTSMDYDIAGHVLHSTDPLGQQSTFAYNNLGQPTSASFPAKGTAPAETVSYVYDANGRTASASDNRGTTVLAYETGCDRVASVTDPVTGTMSYTYGINGNRLSMTLPGGGTWTYGYPTDTHLTILPDDVNKIAFPLTSLTDDQGRRIDCQMDSMGPIKSTKYAQTFDAANLTTLLSYCQATYGYVWSSTPGYGTNGCLQQITNTYNYKDAGGVWRSKLLVGNTYTYDNAGQRLTNTISSLDAGGSPLSRVETYGYDELNRLNSVNYGDGQTQGYTFDAMGNRLSKTDAGGGLNGTETYGYNNANMLLARAGNNYVNDADGNTLTGGGRTNTWDSQNRMVKCVNGANTSTFTYGADGIRRRSVVNGAATDFVTDASMFVRELSGGSSKATYFMGASGPAYRRDDVTSGIRWYLYDGLGSVLGEVDPTGNITATRKYDVYGAVRSSTGTSTSKHKFVGQLGHPSEDETNLTYMRARYYDPQTGRFTNEDPSNNGVNWFIYCENAPTNKYDPTGKAGLKIEIGSGWWIRIDNPTSGSLPEERDLHWGDRSGDLGSVFEGGAWKHNRGNLPTNRVKKAAAKAGWLGNLEALEVCSVVAYFEQNPLDCIAILLDCSGEFELANRVDQLNNSL